MPQTRPNILFILVDDHAAKSISAYKGGLNHTPNIDRIAEEGMLFNHCYVNNSICTPSRAAILSGTHSHVNLVKTLASTINTQSPNVAKSLRAAGYQTAMCGKWHLGEGPASEPSGFDWWSVVPGQGQYHDPLFIDMGSDHKPKMERGYATNIITDKCLSWLKKRDTEKPFFMMCHHKAPHRSWEYDPKHEHLYTEEIKLPDTFTDDYRNRAKAAAAAQMRVECDMTYQDLALSQPEGPASRVGELMWEDGPWFLTMRKIPMPDTDAEVAKMRLIDQNTGQIYIFKTRAELSHWKYQRYMQRYLRTIQSVDDNVGRMLDYIDSDPEVRENTLVIYSSDQGFFLGEHGWFDKRFLYQESFQMPFLLRYPKAVKPGSVCDEIISNVDFAPTWLELAGVRVPSYMQGFSIMPLLDSRREWKRQVAYHRYWMHRDEIHNAYAHYGIRNERYKLIYWYNEDFGLPGTRPGAADEKEWELFDCEEDPLELFNCWAEPKYEQIREDMVQLLNDKMAEIGDDPVHRTDVDAKTLALIDAGKESDALHAAKEDQKNL